VETGKDPGHTGDCGGFEHCTLVCEEVEAQVRNKGGDQLPLQVLRCGGVDLN